MWAEAQLPMERHVFWQPWTTTGSEHLHLQVLSGAVVADGVVLGVAAGEPFHVHYVLHCDPQWRVQQLLIERLDGSRHIMLHADGHGQWTDEHGLLLPQLDGCIDVDISATPFTNTLPINRLPLAPGEARDILVVYIAVPELQLSVEEQRYTCIERHAGGATWQFRSLGSDFVADLPVDSDGIVLAYPHLFRRIPGV